MEDDIPSESLAERRALHNSIERTRREALNAKFSHLAGSMPSLQNVHRPSKSVIISHCLDMVTELKQTRRENARLKREVEILRRATREAAHAAHAAGQHSGSAASTTPSTYSQSGQTPPVLSLSPPDLKENMARNALYYDAIAHGVFDPLENKSWSHEGVGMSDPLAIPIGHRHSLPVDALRPMPSYDSIWPHQQFQLTQQTRQQPQRFMPSSLESDLDVTLFDPKSLSRLDTEIGPSKGPITAAFDDALATPTQRHPLTTS
ncbi:hypothetical protein PYCC9005_002729 [Savitreella phatthalungensis]